MICFFIHPEASIDLGKKVEFKVVYKGKERGNIQILTSKI